MLRFSRSLIGSFVLWCPMYRALWVKLLNDVVVNISAILPRTSRECKKYFVQLFSQSLDLFIESWSLLSSLTFQWMDFFPFCFLFAFELSCYLFFCSCCPMYWTRYVKKLSPAGYSPLGTRHWIFSRPKQTWQWSFDWTPKMQCW